MSKKRGVLVWVLFALATILLFVSSLTVWSKRQLLDDDAWAHSSAQLLANDEVRGAIAQKLSDALFQRVDVEAQLRERLPAQRKGTAAVLAAALQNTVVPTAADRLLQRPRVQALWENANKRAHAAVLRVLEGKELGKNGNISTANGEVTLDLRPAIMRLATRLGLEDKLKANADPNAGQLVLMKSSQLSAAQTAVKILKALSSLLLIAVVALYALAIYLAQGRRRLLLGATGASLVLVGLVIASLRRFLGGAIVDALVKTEANKQPGSLLLHLTSRHLVRKGQPGARKGTEDDYVPTSPSLGHARSGQWDALPSEDWIELSQPEWKKLLPAGSVAVGSSWDIHKETATKLLTRFYPTTESNDLCTNRIDRQSPSGAGSRPPSEITRSSSGRPLSPCSCSCSLWGRRPAIGSWSGSRSSPPRQPSPSRRCGGKRCGSSRRIRTRQS